MSTQNEPTAPPDDAPSHCRSTTSRLAGWVVAAAVLHLLFAGLVSVANALGPDRIWWGVLNLYLPQWIWAAPSLLLAPLLARFRPKWAFVPLLTAAWVAGPVMGLTWTPAHRAGRGTRLRVMTFNIKWAGKGYHAIAEEIRRADPDVLLMQDADDAFQDELAACLKGWAAYDCHQYIVAAKLPLGPPEVRSLAFPGCPIPLYYVRCPLWVGGRQVALYDAHLYTPRWGLWALARERSGVDALEYNASARLHQARTQAEAVRQERLPVILAGDLNAPVQALPCRTLFETGLHDAFNESGRGYGYTYGQDTQLHHSFVRIDHILASAPFEFERCWTGTASASAHRPVIADLRLAPAGENPLAGSVPAQ